MTILWSSGGETSWGPVSTSGGGPANSDLSWIEITNTASTVTSNSFARTGSQSIKQTVQGAFPAYGAVRNTLNSGALQIAALPGATNNNHRDVWMGGYFYLPVATTIQGNSIGLWQWPNKLSGFDDVVPCVVAITSGNKIRASWWGGNSVGYAMPFASSTDSYYDEIEGPVVTSGVWHHLEMHLVWNTFNTSPTINYDGNIDFYLDGVAWSLNRWNNCALRPSWFNAGIAYMWYGAAYPTSGSPGDPVSIYWDDLYISDTRIGTSGAMSTTMSMTVGMSGRLTGPQLPAAGGFGGLA